MRRLTQPALYAQLCLGVTTLLLTSCTAAGDLTNTSANNSPTTTTKIGGSSETYEILEVLTEAYSEQSNQVDFEFLPPSQTNSGIQGTQNRELDIGGISRELTTTETSSQLNYTPLAEVPLLVVVHETVTDVDNLTTEDLQNIYSGQVNNWQQLGGPDAEIVLLDLTEDENEKKVFREQYLGEDFVITSQAVVFAEDDALIEAAGNTDYSLAVVPLEDEIAEVPVKLLSLDGVIPSAENLKTQTYGMGILLGMVSHSEANPEVQGFIDFITGPEGQDLLSEVHEELLEDEA